MRPTTSVFKFRATYTDGSRGIVRGMATCDRNRSRTMALQIARKDNVQSVKVLEIPNGK